LGNVLHIEYGEATFELIWKFSDVLLITQRQYNSRYLMIFASGELLSNSANANHLT
jgi:hypothetical protein